MSHVRYCGEKTLKNATYPATAAANAVIVRSRPSSPRKYAQTTASTAAITTSEVRTPTTAGNVPSRSTELALPAVSCAS